MIELEKLRDTLEDLVENAGGSYSRKIKADPALLEAVMFYTADVSGVRLKTRVYRILAGPDVKPKCANCGKTMNNRDVKNVREGYHKYCCPKCAKDSDVRKALYAGTCLDRFGVPNASSAESVKARRAATNVRRLGVDNPAKSEEIRRRIAKTNESRYGAACALHSEECARKTAATNMERYGDSSYSRTEEFREKTTAANRARFGVDYPNQDPAVRRGAQKRYKYRGMGFDSAPELAFYIWAEDHGVLIEHQPGVSFPYSAGGQSFVYQPDFRADGALVEIKGLQFFENRDPSGKMINPYDRSQDEVYEAKHRCMLENGVKIMTDYSEYVEYIRSAYGKDYLKGFKR